MKGKTPETIRPWTAAEAVGKVVMHRIDRDCYVLVMADQTTAACGILEWDLAYLASPESAWTQPDGSPCGVPVQPDQQSTNPQPPCQTGASTN
jgi:hypothetical protein